MSDKDEARARVDKMFADFREQVKPHVDSMVLNLRQAYMAEAQLAGDDVTPANKTFWQIAGNIFVASNATLDPSGPEVAALVTLSKAIATSSRFVDWAGSAGICQRLFDSIDGGEELGLSDDWMDIDFNDPDQRAVALQKGMQFHRVPRSYQTAIADVVAGIMLATPDSWNYEGTQLRQPWAMCCTYVVFAIAERVQAADHTLGDGQHRHAGFH